MHCFHRFSFNQKKNEDKTLILKRFPISVFAFLSDFVPLLLLSLSLIISMPPMTHVLVFGAMGPLPFTASWLRRRPLWKGTRSGASEKTRFFFEKKAPERAFPFAESCPPRRSGHDQAGRLPKIQVIRGFVLLPFRAVSASA